MQLVLASGSPRRQTLFRLFGFPFVIHPAELDEWLPTGIASPRQVAMRLARQKAEQVAQHYSDALVLGADTVVWLDGEILGKPVDREDACRMLQRLSGRTHTVITAVCFLQREKGVTTRLTLDAPRSKVTFRELSDRWIEWYLETGEPFDKAGAYGIQEYGALLIEKVESCYFNVAGLPLAIVARRLEEFGWFPARVDLIPQPPLLKREGEQP